MPLSLETLLAISSSAIGALLLMIISLIVYVFLTLKQEVRGVSSEVAELNRHKVKLVHIDTCRLTVSRFDERLDDCVEAVQGLSERMARSEALLQERGGHS